MKRIFAILSMVLITSLTLVACKEKESKKECKAECNEKCDCKLDCCKEKCTEDSKCKGDCCKKSCHSDDKNDSTKTGMSKKGESATTKSGTSTDPFETANYFCPMKCEGGYSDSPGKCVTCGMDLKKREI